MKLDRELNSALIDFLQPVIAYCIDAALEKHGIANSAHADRPNSAPSQNNHVYGIDGLARLLGCSKPTAHRLKASGQIPYSQVGRKIVFDSQAVLSAIHAKK